MIRIAAAADIHLGRDLTGHFRRHLDDVTERADVLLLAGDLTKCGSPEEADVVAAELEGVPVPVVAVLGNHDYHADAENYMMKRLEDAGVRVLEGTSTVVEVNGARVGIAGTKGFGGGFAGASGTDFGEPEMKAFIRHTKHLSEQLEENLRELDTEVRVALLHYAPIRGTLEGEKLEIYPFLGSFLLAEGIDAAGCDLVVHGHAHAGREKGVTPGGVHVRNVAQPVLRHGYAVYELDPSRGSRALSTPA